jgi:hypothetical protein
MTLKMYALYLPDTGLVENTIVVDDEIVSSLEFQHSIVEAPDGLVGEWSTFGAGWSYINGQFIEPPQPPQTVQPTSQGAQTL